MLNHRLSHGDPKRQWSLPDLDAVVVMLYCAIRHGFLVWPHTSTKEGSDANCIMLGGNDVPLAQFVQRGQVLFVHDLLLDAVARGGLVRGFKP